MRPHNLSTKIFLDSGDPKETRSVLDVIGFLDGQTTNPSLIAKNPDVQARLARGETFTKDEIYDFYKETAKAIADLIPDGSVSVEVYADANTKAEEMVAQGNKMCSWVPHAHIKCPTTSEGLKAMRQLIDGGKRVNATLVFCQQQAAAVYAATEGASRGDVFVSPFEGRLHDHGTDGMDVVLNIQRMYQEHGDGHAEVLMASVRDYRHFLYALYKGVDIITTPYEILMQWGKEGTPVPGADTDEAQFADENEYLHADKDVSPAPYEAIALDRHYGDYDIQHELTDKGLAKFAKDWNALLGSNK